MYVGCPEETGCEFSPSVACGDSSLVRGSQGGGVLPWAARDLPSAARAAQCRREPVFRRPRRSNKTGPRRSLRRGKEHGSSRKPSSFWTGDGGTKDGERAFSHHPLPPLCKGRWRTNVSRRGCRSGAGEVVLQPSARSYPVLTTPQSGPDGPATSPYTGEASPAGDEGTGSDPVFARPASIFEQQEEIPCTFVNL